jgi:cell filamentation protein
MNSCYPNTNVLMNKLNIQNQEKLEKAERIFTALRLAEINLTPISGNFDLAHLQSIHQAIFKDLYDFAGEIRSVQVVKGATQFASPLFIESYANDLFLQLSKENFLRGLDHSTFAKRAAYYMSEVNMLHPFRDGNGRTIREFIRLIGLQCGFEMDWSMVDKETLLQASIKSITDTSDLEKVLKGVIGVNHQ